MAFVENKKAMFDYEFLKEFEAGLSLLGCEVKSIKSGKANIKNARAVVRGGEGYMIGAEITPFQPNNVNCRFEKDRPRKLLLRKKELIQIQEAEDKKGLTALVVSLYNKRGKIKAKVVIARGKKKHDKREKIKERDLQRQMRRSLKYS